MAFERDPKKGNTFYTYLCPYALAACVYTHTHLKEETSSQSNYYDYNKATAVRKLAAAAEAWIELRQ